MENNSNIKTLFSDTVVYGVSTVLGRLLNWLLMPLYIRTIPKAEYGVVSDVYAVISVLLVLVTLGFETGYFKFVTDDNRKRLINTQLNTILIFGSFVTALFYFFNDSLCQLFNLHVVTSNIFFLAALIVMVDSYNSVLFADLRFKRKSVKYSVLRLIQVVVTVLFNLFFIFYLRFQTIAGFDFSTISNVNYILFANLLGSLSSTLYFLPSLFRLGFTFDTALLRQSMFYCMPLVGMGLLGMLNQNIEKMLIPHLDYHDDTLAQLGEYSANYKIGILMAIFTQSFRLAFEPIIFKNSRSNSDKKSLYGDALKYFVYFGLIIFAFVMLLMPLVNKFILKPEYYEGNIIIPFVLIGQLFFGVYYSLSMWYKVIDKTYFGLIMSAIGLVVNLVLEFILVPQLGILGAAISVMCGFFVMMITSFLLEHRYYPISYPFKKIISTFLIVTTLVLALTYLYRYVYTDYWIFISIFGLFLVLLIFVLIERKNVIKLLNYVRHRR